MFIPNFSKYINPASSVPESEGLQRSLAALQQRALAANQMRQRQKEFTESELRAKKEHEDSVRLQTRVADDVNERYAIGVEKEYAQNQQQIDERNQRLLASTRAAIASGRLNEAEANLGALKEAGATVEKSVGPDGQPVYRLNYTPKATGRTYEDVIGRLNGGQSSQPQSSPEVPQPNVQNPETSRQDQFTNPAQSSESQSVQTPQTDQNPSGPQSSFDPYSLDVGSLRQMNEMRLNPMLEGIQNAFPSRFQSQIGNYLETVPRLGMSPEASLDLMQKPLDTISRLYGAELGAEGQMARASIGQSAGASSEERMRENTAYDRAERQAKDIGLYDEVKNLEKFASVKQRIQSGNPNMQADAIKELISMREGNRITDQDFTIGLNGLASNIEQLKTDMRRIYAEGLSPLQTYRFEQMVDALEDKSDAIVRRTMPKMRTFRDSHRHEPERYGIDVWIRGAIPQQYWDDPAKKFDPQANAGGRKVRDKSSVKTNVSTSAPTPQQAVEGAGELQEFLE